jgi:hypothetical protein
MRFRYTRNQCFNLNIYDKDLVDLAYSGLSPHLKEKIECYIFLTLARSCSGLWTTKAEAKSIGASLGLAISLGTSAMLIRSSTVASHRTTKRSICV